MLGADVVVSQLQRLAEREFQDLLGARGEGDVSGRGLLALPDDLLHLLADAVERNAQGLKGFGSNTFTFMDQTQEDVFGTNVIVVQHACLFLGKHNYATGTVRKSLKHFATLLATTYFDATWPGSRIGACSPQGKPGRRSRVTSGRERGPAGALQGRPVGTARPCRRVRDGRPAGPGLHGALPGLHGALQRRGRRGRARQSPRRKAGAL
ncbi:hypothetical protein BJQ90_00944 [Arthrobacter sp. SO3]|nr:hypothetical protein [Arthrobacter sp. SO3]